jgi:hypothetical protein
MPQRRPLARSLRWGAGKVARRPSKPLYGLPTACLGPPLAPLKLPLNCEVGPAFAFSAHHRNALESPRRDPRLHVLSLCSVPALAKQHTPCDITLGCRKRTCADRVPPEAQAVFRRRRHQPRRSPLAKIRPRRPAPTTGLHECRCNPRK